METSQTLDIEQLRYPIGKFKSPEGFTSQDIDEWVSVIGRFPAMLKAETANLSDTELQYRYKPEGWSIRQVVHHCADSHMNSLIRYKLALTEEEPTIKPYHEDKWAELPDSQLPIAPSLQIVEGVHARLTELIRSLSNEQLERTYIHPQQGRKFSLWQVAALYAWHSKHHLEHIKLAKQHKF